MIGFFGGAFDPVHFGHLKNAVGLKKELNLSQLFLMPCGQAVDKNSLHFSRKQRLDMLKIALTEFSELSIDRREILQKDPSRTIDSLQSIRREYPNKTIYFIMGMDSFNRIHTWKNYQDFGKYVKIAVLGRPQYSTNQTKTDGVYFAKTKLLNISSTQIRSKINNKQDLSGLLPDSIINYIQQL